MKPKGKWIPNPEWENASEVHIIAHPSSGIRCGCSYCRDNPPIARPLPGSKLLIAKVDCTGKYVLDKDGNWVQFQSQD